MIDPKELMIGDYIRVYKEIGLLQFDVMRIHGIHHDYVTVIDEGVRWQKRHLAQYASTSVKRQ